MTATRDSLSRPFLRACLAAILLAQVTTALSQAPIIQPGAPGKPVVARAYIDQLERGDQLSTSFAADLAAVLDHAASRLSDGTHDEDLATKIDSMAATLEHSALVETLAGITARLR